MGTYISGGKVTLLNDLEGDLAINLGQWKD